MLKNTLNQVIPFRWKSCHAKSKKYCVLAIAAAFPGALAYSGSKKKVYICIFCKSQPFKSDLIHNVFVYLYFLKPFFFKGKILRSSERGVNSILTTILRF